MIECIAIATVEVLTLLTSIAIAAIIETKKTTVNGRS